MGGLIEREAVRDEIADIKLAGEDEAGDFALQCEIGGVAAEEVFLVNANRGKIDGEETGGLILG